jgi:hypothetical protein
MMHGPNTFVIPYSFQELVLKHESTIKMLEVQLHDETQLQQSIVKHHSEETQARSKSFCFTFQFELTHRQAKDTKIEELSSRVDDLSKLLEHEKQENQGLIGERAFVSRLQDQYSIVIDALEIANRHIRELSETGPTTDGDQLQAMCEFLRVHCKANITLI